MFPSACCQLPPDSPDPPPSFSGAHQRRVIFSASASLTGEAGAVGKIGDDPLSAFPEVSGPSPLELIVFAVPQRARETDRDRERERAGSV